MTEEFINGALCVIAFILFCVLVWWLLDRGIEAIFPDDAAREKRAREEFQAAITRKANKEFFSRLRLRAGFFNQWRKS